MKEPYQDIVTIFPPEKPPDGRTLLLKFQTRSGEVAAGRMHCTDWAILVP